MVKIETIEEMAWSSGAALQEPSELRTAAQVLACSLPPIHSKKLEGLIDRASRWLVRFQKGILEGSTEGDDGREERRVGDAGEAGEEGGSECPATCTSGDRRA